MDNNEAKNQEEAISLIERHTESIPGKSHTILNKGENVISRHTIIHTDTISVAHSPGSFQNIGEPN